MESYPQAVGRLAGVVAARAGVVYLAVLYGGLGRFARPLLLEGLYPSVWAAGAGRPANGASAAEGII
jgi:hypothetical protein